MILTNQCQMLIALAIILEGSHMVQGGKAHMAEIAQILRDNADQSSTMVKRAMMLTAGRPVERKPK